MRYIKSLMVIFCLLIFVCLSGSGYCFFRDDMDHERIIKEVVEKRQESEERFRKNQEKERLEQIERIKTQELVSKKNKEMGKVPARSTSIMGIMVFVILCLGLGGYLFYRLKRKNS